MTHHDARARDMDCTDIRVVLSGLLDDELDGSDRQRAERHISSCAACRALLDRHEALDDELRRLACPSDAPLPFGLEESVLARTTRLDGARPPGWIGLGGGAGWLVAAAVLAVAATLHLREPSTVAPSTALEPARDAWRGSGSFEASPARPAPTVARWQPGHAAWAGVRAPVESMAIGAVEVAETHSTVSSAVASAPSSDAGTAEPRPRGDAVDARAPMDAVVVRVSDVEPPGAELHGPPAPTDLPRRSRRDGGIGETTIADADAVALAATLLDGLAQARRDSFADVERIRAIAAYDDLGDRLAAARLRLPEDERPTLLAAESIILRVVRGPIDQDDLDAMRHDADRLGVVRRLLELADRIESRRDA